MSQSSKQPLIVGIIRMLRITKPHIPANNTTKQSGVETIPTYDLNLEKILIEEYRFRANFTIQLQQEINGTFNLLFLLIGICVSGFSIVGFRFTANFENYLQPLTITTAFFFGAVVFCFFLRFLSLDYAFIRNRIGMNIVRECYIKYFQNKMPNISHDLEQFVDTRLSMYSTGILYLIFILFDSFCFACTALVGYEFLFHINNGLLFPLPSEIWPYIITLLVILISIFLHASFYKITIYDYYIKTLSILKKWGK